MTIYVGNLAVHTTATQLREAFAPYGQVSRVAIKKDKDSGLPRGFGFVRMDQAEEAETAIAELHGTLLGDQPLQVRKARLRAEHADKRGNRNGPR